VAAKRSCLGICESLRGLTASALEALISKMVRGGGERFPSWHLRILEGPDRVSP
jgi:hypothetical protein